ncbi:unnamed protein product [Coregonus sp. 'balchen']|nr:unnamed protein product [Coregonus sp. 'balchen']
MDSLDVSHHPYPPGHLTPVKSNTSTEHLGGGKRDSAYSSFSTSSGTPDYILSKSNAASTENMLYEVSQWESRDSPRTEEQTGPGSSHSSSSARASCGPVWHVPDKKKTSAPSPPPPPPVRSDSFAATKSHEKGLVLAYPDGPGAHTQPKSHEKGLVLAYPDGPGAHTQPKSHEKGLVLAYPDGPGAHTQPKSHEKGLVLAYPDGPGAHTQPKSHGKGLTKGMDSDNSQRTNGARRSHHNLASKNNMVPPYISPENCHQNQVNCNKLYSLSSSDVRLGQPTDLPCHQRQHSNESSLYSHPRTSSVPKQQNASGFYSSMQELPTNYNTQNTQLYSLSPDSTGDSRYYCVTARQPGQLVTQAQLVKTDEWRGGVGREEGVEGGGDRKSLTPQGSGVTKAKYQPPTPLNNDSKGYSKQDDGFRLKQPATISPSAVLDSCRAQPSAEEQPGLKRNGSQTAEPHDMSYPPRRQSLQPLQQDTIHCQEMLPDRSTTRPSQICPQTTSGLSNSGLRPRDCSSQETVDLSSKQCRRNDRFATTLRNEIQMRRAQLQKSESAASLSGPCEAEEDHEVPEVWRPKNTTSSSDGSFTSTYKDHLKEAQARVLKATSFRRRDLEPVLLEHPGAEAGSLPVYPSSGLGRRDNFNPLSSLSEGLPARSGSAQSQVTRIGGRKRFTTEKKVRCFSEPDKINEVGVEEELTLPEAAGSLLNRRSTARPAFTRSLPKTALPGPVEDCGEGKERSRGDSNMSSSRKELRETRTRATPEGGQGQDHRQQALLELQRLGTFAEYEATWNTQKKAAGTRGSGRPLSADNFLDPGGDDRTKPAPVHERSRSSPSADFYDKVRSWQCLTWHPIVFVVHCF